MKNIVLSVIGIVILFVPLTAQIYEPEGLNIPGQWNSYTNPPATNSVFGSSTQVSGGKVTKITTGTTRWQTTIKAASSGGDVTGGTYTYLFTSGSSGSPYSNKWANVSTTVNTVQTYTYLTTGGSDNSITVADGKWYTMNWQDQGYANTRAAFLETSGDPVTIFSVTDNSSIGDKNTDVTISITLSSSKSAEENMYVRYTTDNWFTDNFVLATGSGTSYSVNIGTLPNSGTVKYYILSTTGTWSNGNDLDTYPDLMTIKLNNNSGSNYQYDYDENLPVELTSFTAQTKGNRVDLAWQTATENNNHGFEIERKSSRTTQWQKIGFKDGQGTTNSVTNYSYSDNTVSIGSYQYRLKQIDRDGKFTFSAAIETSVGLSPSALKLNGNYPNPFNPSTSISFTLGTTGRASLKVFDILGKEVATVAEGIYNAGELNTFTFNASRLTSGVYYYRLTSGANIVTRKMILMK